MASAYIRDNSSLPIKVIKDIKLKGTLRRNERKVKHAAEKALDSEMLLLEDYGFLEGDNEMERTWKLSQKELKNHVDLNTSKKMFDLRLEEFGAYGLDYTRNGRNMLIGGRLGHVASFDWKSGKLDCEMHLRETVKDVAWLHNETMFAVAQKKYTYIYDRSGLEIHCLKDHIEANRITFLPYHYLLASVGNAGFLKYQDISTGSLVAEHRTKLGKCKTMAQNTFNSIIHLGHSNGTVTLWSPTMSTPLVKMLCHHGPVLSIAMDLTGKYMVTSGLDGQMKVWDIRTYKQLSSYFTPSPAASITVSQRGLIAMGCGSSVKIWKDAFTKKQKEPYMTHSFPGASVSQLKFCPFEDLLGCGHAMGISSMVVPGSGEANFDTMEANPYQTTKQRQESEVHSLLDKIQPEMITIDPTIVARVDRAPVEVIRAEQKKEWEANHPNEKFTPKNRVRGKSSSMRRYLRKQTNVVDERRGDVIKAFEVKKAENEAKRKLGLAGIQKSALDRFAQ